MSFLSSIRRALVSLSAGIIILSLVSISQAAPPAAKSIREWTLRDYLRRDWQNELVTYPVDEKTAANKKLALEDDTGAAHPYQWLREGQRTKIAFLADLAPDTSRTYRLVAKTPQTTTDLKLEETEDAIQLSNGKTGIRIRKQLEENDAPIAAMRLASGGWVGDSQRLGTPELVSYKAQVVERGPVLCEVLCEAKFAGEKNWRMRFRLLAGEPIVLINESSSVGPGASWRFSLDKFTATNYFQRRGMPSSHIRTNPVPTKNGVFCQVEPWLRWWDSNCTPWLGLYGEQSDDMWMVGAINCTLWRDLDKLRNKIPQAPPQISMAQENGAVRAEFDLTGGVRRWLLGALNKTQSLQPLEGKDNMSGTFPLPQQYTIKYGDFPLDQVKDYVLDWPEKATHPRLMTGPQEIARLKQFYTIDPARLQQYQKSTTIYSYIDALAVYLATGDEQVGRSIIKTLMDIMQGQVNVCAKQEGKGSLGAWPHSQHGIISAFIALDVIWPALTPEERQRLKAQAAFIGYAVSKEDFWSLERGFHANPNMTTMIAGYKVAAGYLLADHPLSKVWARDGLAEGKRQLENWSDGNGGWLEAPHYANVSYDYLLGMFVMARSDDGGALLFHPKAKKVAEFFAKIATPPDVGVGGIRHHARIGNTWLDEPSGLYGVLAAIWKERDPKFASEMQWAYQQHGSWPANGIGGGFVSFAGIRPAFLDPSIPAVKPDYTSTLFPDTGVSLRNGVDDRETQLYMIAGGNHDHYDNDSGSITIWGKGRIVANDFAYAEAAGKFHSMVEGGGRTGLLYVDKFKTTPSFDYVHGLSGQWHRQIAFVKDSDMMAPNYFVIRDSTATPTAAIWRLWLDGQINLKQPSKDAAGLAQQAVQLTGKQDLDTDIFLISKGEVKVTTEEKTTKLFGLGPNKVPAGNQEYGLTGLIAPMAAGQNLVAVVFPRLKTQKPPRVTSLSQGRVLKIEHEAGTDYVLLNQTPFTFTEGDIQFEGNSGLIKIRDGKATVELGEGTKLTALGQTAK